MTGRCKNLEIFLPHNQCDQIRRFFVLWAIIQSQWQQLFYPNQPTLLGNFCKGVKVIHFSSEITFGQLLWTIGHLAIFIWSHCSQPSIGAYSIFSV